MIGVLIFAVLLAVGIRFIYKRHSGSGGSSPAAAPQPSKSVPPVTPGTTAPAPVPAPNALAQEILDIHNKLRAKHGVPPLVWDESLAQYAQNHANTCVFQHTGGPHGENLAAGYRSATAGVQAWYDEISLYDYNNPGFTKGVGHFTQVIWKSSKRVGGALHTCNGANGTPGVYLVCEYDPPGNITNSGYFAANVLPPIN